MRAATVAGEFLLDRSRGALDVRRKSSARDLVTDADLRAETIVLDVLGAERPDDATVGEEHGAQRGSSGVSWAVDALDGTSNFVAGIPHWAVAVACDDGEGPLAAVVFDPTRNELFAAARSRGARLNGTPVRGSTCAALDGAVAALGGAPGRLVEAIAHGRRMGSLALDLAWTAAGRFDLFYYECGLNPWDVSLRVLADEAGLATDVLQAHGALLACPTHLRERVLALIGPAALH